MFLVLFNENKTPPPMFFFFFKQEEAGWQSTLKEKLIPLAFKNLNGNIFWTMAAIDGVSVPLCLLPAEQTPLYS